MKPVSFIIIFLITSLAFSKSTNAQDTLLLHPINWETPSPEGWNAQYIKEINFPKKKGPWAKILMIHTLKCDSSTKGDKYPCGEWDYIWNTLLEVPTKDSIEVFSIGSFVTPYGKGLYLGGQKGWEWTYDISDYAPILKGRRKIIVGNNQELLDLKFLFIKGIPARDFLRVDNLYPHGKYKYSDLSEDLVLKEKSVKLLPEASGYKLKSVISGHGHEGPRNCCEWDSKTHTYLLSGWEIFRWNVWKDCGNNSIYPQGGTWPFDRAGWCPGTKVDEYEFELTPYVKSGDLIHIDYAIEPYSDNGEKEGFFYMTHQIFSYGKPNFKNDAEIIDIMSPTDKQKFSRFNPSLMNPKIVIKNNGQYDLKSVDIFYGLKSRKKSIFKWNGNLEFLEEEIITLPTPRWNGIKKSKNFVVTLKNPNNTKDENLYNNTLLSIIPIPDLFPKKFLLRYFTNNINRARENSFTISNMNGNVLYSEEKFSDSTEYIFTMKLKNGDYQFVLKDKMEDGISKHWWNRTSSPEKIGINGAVQFLSISGDTLKNFSSDFGQEIRYNFHVGPLP